MARPRRESPRPRRESAPRGGLPTPGTRVNGVFQSIRRGGGFVVPDTGDYGDIAIAQAATTTALHGDHVQVEVTRMRRDGKLGGAIVRVLRHANQHIVGRVTHRGRLSVVVPKNQKIDRVLEIHKRLDPEAVPDGAWVVAEVTRWSSSPQEPLQGKLAEVLGVEGDKGLPILLLIRGAGVPDAFTPEVEAEAEALRAEPIPHDPRRRDFRNERIVTIDPATAKDFDDAVGILGSDKHGWRVGVHIADVAHYVRPGTALDDEAYVRATSIYPVDRVIPMLPEALSNALCSLREGEDKLTMSALFTITPGGKVRDVELCNGTIRSARRFAYEQVQAVFDEVDREAGAKGEASERALPVPAIDDAMRGDLLTLREAARALASARDKRGALDLDLPEPQFDFDADGRPTGLRHAPRYEAHRLIEELMIAANEAVARTLEAGGYPALFRVHEEPKASRAFEIAPALARLGIPMPPKGELTRAQLQAVLDQAREHPAAQIVQQWVLRTLMRARYQPENIGHFGLASESYLHFTSPIRRYPDLIVHRIVKAMLDGAAPDGEEMNAVRDHLTEWGRHTSTREHLAQKVEWDAEAIVALDYMRRHHLGDIFEAFVAGVNPMGFFVALVDYPVEGLVRISSVEDDYYDLDEDYHIWRSRSSGATIAMGDAVTVAIERIDVLAGQMDLRLLRRSTKGSNPTGKRAGKGKGKGKSAPHRGRPGPPRSKKGKGRRR